MPDRPQRKRADVYAALRRLLHAVEHQKVVRVNGAAMSVRHPIAVELRATRSLVSGDLHIGLSWRQGTRKTKGAPPLVGVLGGSKSDFPILQKTVEVLTQLGVPSELLVVSAHRTPDRLFAYAEQAAGRGIEVIVAGAGGAAHLPGMLAAKTHLPVIGVPIPTQSLQGIDSLLSIAQMPKGIPVATVAIGGAENAGLLAAQILAGRYQLIREQIKAFRAKQSKAALRSSPKARHWRRQTR